MKHHFIINPAAGKGTHVHTLAQKIRDVAEARGIEHEVYLTCAPGDAATYVARTVAADEDCHRFYACGGDGTLGEVVNGAPHCDRAEFALIPIGTGNDFCRNFDDRAAFFDIERQIDGETMAIDLIRYNDRYCVNMMNVGFDCNVVDRTVKLKKSPIVPSGLAYTAGVAISLAHKMTTEMHITFENGETISRPLLLISIGNGKYYGGGFRSNPQAVLDDGLFDVNIVERVSRVTFLNFVSSYKAGTHPETAPKYVIYRKEAALELHFPQETLACVDGELERVQDLKISLARSAARFVLPRGVRCISSLYTEENEQVAKEEHHESV